MHRHAVGELLVLRLVREVRVRLSRVCSGSPQSTRWVTCIRNHTKHIHIHTTPRVSSCVLGSSSYCQGLMPRPHAKAWDPEEDQLILEMKRLTTEGPNSWEQIVKQLPGRTVRVASLANLGAWRHPEPPRGLALNTRAQVASVRNRWLSDGCALKRAWGCVRRDISPGLPSPQPNRPYLITREMTNLTH